MDRFSRSVISELEVISEFTIINPGIKYIFVIFIYAIYMMGYIYFPWGGQTVLSLGIGLLIAFMLETFYYQPGLGDILNLGRMNLIAIGLAIGIMIISELLNYLYPDPAIVISITSNNTQN